MITDDLKLDCIKLTHAAVIVVEGQLLRTLKNTFLKIYVFVTGTLISSVSLVINTKLLQNVETLCHSTQNSIQETCLRIRL